MNLRNGQFQPIKYKCLWCWGRVDGEERQKTRKIRASQTFLTALSAAFPSTHVSPPLALAPPPLCWAISQPSKITKEKKN